MSLEDTEKFITDDLNNKAGDIARFIQEANKQEFKVCRFFIGWGTASLGALSTLYLKNFDIASPNTTQLLYLREALLPLTTSIFLGILHHLFFLNKLLKKANQFDGKIRNRVKRIIDKERFVVENIRKELINEYTNEPAIVIGFKGFLYAQIFSFFLAILIIGYIVYF